MPFIRPWFSEKYTKHTMGANWEMGKSNSSGMNMHHLHSFSSVFGGVQRGFEGEDGYEK